MAIEEKLRDVVINVAQSVDWCEAPILQTKEDVVDVVSVVVELLS